SGKGGGALSAVSASKTSITFIGTGEKLNALEAYDSKKFVGRLLGMPDLESLVLKVQEAVKSANIKEDEADIENLSFDTFYKQLKAMQNVGPMKNILGMMGMSDVPKDVLETGETKLKKYGSIISSMTRKERNSDRLVKEHSRIARIAKGSGTTEKDVRELISDFNKMKKFATMFKNNRDLKKNISKFMPGM
ncbi:MAG: signal recognition particle protein Srp19, partial [Candidatus Micrarchaeota archaeon]|nr:signal recognition particle protein Srp19 [Candidatus Micrarchaeota archaeon]